MNKPALVKTIIAQLTETVTRYLGAAKTAHAESTHEENKAEDQYDTRGLEASYLAAGQSRQLEETAAALRQFAAMVVPRFGRSDAIDVGALVETESRDGRAFYFIGPSAGGTEVMHEKVTVLVITPQSPLGQQLVGRKQGDRLKIKIGGLATEYRVVNVS